MAYQQHLPVGAGWFSLGEQHGWQQHRQQQAQPQFIDWQQPVEQFSGDDV